MYRSVHDNNKAKQEALIKAFNSRGGSFTAADLECDGCLAEGRLSPWCRQCEIKSCAKRKPGEIICSPDCPDFPCSALRDFLNAGLLHHEEVMDNLRRFHEKGLVKHAEDEERRWLCPQCKTPMSWYDRTCHQCGAERSKELFKITKSIY
jgi:hypothetical protein